MNPLTQGEMRTLYMDAVDRRKAVQILAELTLSTTQDIKEWLSIMGLPTNENAYVDRMALYKDGLSDEEIALKASVSKGAIGSWRRQRGLPPNRKGASKGGKEKK